MVKSCVVIINLFCFRDELKKHYSPDSAELKELVDKEVKRSNQDYSHEMKTQHEKWVS